MSPERIHPSGPEACSDQRSTLPRTALMLSALIALAAPRMTAAQEPATEPAAEAAGTDATEPAGEPAAEPATEAAPAEDADADDSSSEVAETPTATSEGTLSSDETTHEPEFLEPPDSPLSEEPPAETPAEESSVWDDFSINAFADAHYMADWLLPDDPTANALGHRAFASSHGFGFAFAGLDVRYATEHFGATLDLRFGQGAYRLIGSDSPVLGNVKQAYASWMPAPGLQFDIGQFDTLYGGEVADSWRNLNYTRGALYYLMQPFYHVGLRGSYQVTEDLGLTAMVVNGTNNPVDNDISPHVGLQAALGLPGGLSMALGYYAGAGSSGFGDASDPTTSDDWEHFVDLVVGGEWGPVSLVFNGDVYASGPDSGVNGRSIYWGSSLALGFKVVDELRLAVRGEILHDPDQYIGDGWDTLSTGTLTFDVRPIDNVIIRLDNRVEHANTAVFTQGSDAMPGNQTWFSSVLGVVVTSDP